jgi:hypothetical protein
VKNYVVAVALSVCASACVAAPAPTPAPNQSVASSATPTPSIAVTIAPAGTTRPVAYRLIPSVPGFATVSPDGRWIVAQGNRDPSPLQLFRIDGTLAREFVDAGRFAGWLPDSTGMFVALEIPQRAPPLSIVELDGRVVRTDLQLSHETLSRDGALIVAQQQESCCMSVTQREIRVARRDGSGTRTLVVSQITAVSHPIELLGVDASHRAVYRDGTEIRRVPLSGGAATTLATAPEYAGVIQGTSSPDGMATFARIPRNIGPERWYLIANDRVSLWDNSLDLIVENSSGPAKGQLAPFWNGPHLFVAQDGSGSVFLVDALTLARTPLAGRLLAGDVVLAHQNDTLLVVRDQVFVLMNIRTGAVRDTGLDLGPFGGPGFKLATLPTGGFVLSNDKATYRID